MGGTILLNPIKRKKIQHLAPLKKSHQNQKLRKKFKMEKIEILRLKRKKIEKNGIKEGKKEGKNKIQFKTLGSNFLSYNSINFSLILIFILSFIILNPVHSQIIDNNKKAEKIVNQWYQIHKNASKYQNIQNNLVELINRALDKNISFSSLINKLNQGVIKSVAPQKLILTLEDDFKQMVKAKNILMKLGFPEELNSYQQQDSRLRASTLYSDGTQDVFLLPRLSGTQIHTQ